MLELQGATESYYNSMMETFKDARQMLSGYLIELNTVGVTELTEGGEQAVFHQTIILTLTSF